MIETLVSILISGGIIAVVVVLVIRAVKRARLGDELPPDELYDGVPYDVYSGERGGFRGSYDGDPQ
jgi:hypothetical protein